MQGGIRGTLDKATRNLALDYRDKIASGKDASGNGLAPLRQATLDGPTHRETDTRIRKFLGDIPMRATGKTADSIKSFRVNSESWEIGSDSARGDMILSSNAKTSHSGSPFSGDTPKAVRDPLTVSEKQMDILEETIVNDLDKVLSFGA